MRHTAGQDRTGSLLAEGYENCKKKWGLSHIVLGQLDIGDVVLPLCKNLCLEDVLPRFADGKAPVLIPNLNEGDLQILLVGVEVDTKIGRAHV